MGRLVEPFVMIDAKGHGTTPCDCGDSAQSSHLGGKKPGGDAGEDEEGREAMEVRHADPTGKSWNLGVMPLDGKENWCVSQIAEVVTIVSVFPNVLPREYKVLSKRLLQSHMEFIAIAGTQRRGYAGNESREKGKVAPRTRDEQILIKWRFQSSSVGSTEYRVGSLDVVSDSQAGLSLTSNGKDRKS